MSVKTDQQWPVIIHTSLENTEIGRLLKQQHKVRVSGTVVQNSCIFPKSGIAFLIVPLQEAVTVWPIQEKVHLDPELTQRLEKFLQVHAYCYVIATAPLHGKEELAVFSVLQQRFFGQLHMIPAHSAEECVQNMLILAKMTCPPVSDLLPKRLQKMSATQLDVEEMVLDQMVANQILNRQECLLVLDTMGSVGAIVGASRDQLLDCGLGKQAVDRMIKFFDKDFCL
ncbi:uncharacterized protein C1orf146 homolog [Lingula anatina]|uniref:Uncharacterized protein C1orf146 homolog n=1 Tax=Lingula anatina TaxID=7574 RepID=A0A1S3ICA6_LINAN|nr:uncharacterized protein C1orf146 homolog [Lingula anatina]XP_013395872.1 uncharacterized protein C1orf146 homolog [Lingula anatina]|eukprot:XP_013395863.1 uncharacterized protein C1orf146 homolog [Lingula anatina]